jgi:hypothetical protein
MTGREGEVPGLPAVVVMDDNSFVVGRSKVKKVK